MQALSANTTHTAASRQQRRPAAASVALPRAVALRAASSITPRHFSPLSVRIAQRLPALAATEQGVQEVTLGKPAPIENDDWIPVCLPEELPKGVRKEVEVEGRQVLLFWYRNQIYAIEGRSPAEGAYSEGFITAKFTQDFCIECPSTGSLFSLKDGSIQSWYPNNPVLRAITPKETCRPLEIYPVKLTQEAISVDVSGSIVASRRQDRGGAGTSIENNNVFTVQPNVYFEGMDPSKEQASLYQDAPPAPVDPAIAALTVVAFGATAVVGTAVSLYLIGTS